MAISTAMTEQEFDLVRRLVEERSGIVLDADKQYLVRQRLSQVCRQRALPGLEALFERLRRGGAHGLTGAVVDAMTTNETSFFRDVHPFDSLADHVLPWLFAAPPAGRTIRVWSAACSSGQEVYSIAMLLEERFGHHRHRVEMLATDLSQQVIDRARRGVYSEVEIGRGLSPERRARHFRRHADGWEIDPRLRGGIDFRVMNLNESWLMLPRMDLILLRNVLIYFSAGTRARLVRKLSHQLATDGFLFLGSTERAECDGTPLVNSWIGRSSCYRLQAARALA